MKDINCADLISKIHPKLGDVIGFNLDFSDINVEQLYEIGQYFTKKYKDVTFVPLPNNSSLNELTPGALDCWIEMAQKIRRNMRD